MIPGREPEMNATDHDPFAGFKAMQREAWAVFAPVEIFTTPAAAKLVKFARVGAGQRVLDIACGTGVVSVTAARHGAKVSALDLSPALLERANKNAGIAGHEIEFVEGDAEKLPWPDASFDVVLSQFGHIFAPRPEVALAEMLRVVKPGGTIAFSSWPPELFVGKQFALTARYLPPPPEGAPKPAPVTHWGDPTIVRERFGERVEDITFKRDMMITQALSVPHSRAAQEATIGPINKLVGMLANDPPRLARYRAELEALLEEVYEDNCLHLHYLMTRARKKA